MARRHCWVEEDRVQPLMPCSDPLWLVEAPLALARLTGIDASLIPESEVSVFCVPLAEDDWPERGLRRWEGTRADALWHPLLWLPARLAAPMVSVGPDGVAVEEPLERWQARVAFEITSSGLYTGDGWVDVYALLGLSVENPVDVARVAAWLAGGSDEQLDRFSLEPFFADDQHDADSRLTAASGGHDLDRAVSDWSASLAAEVTPLLVSSARALMADSLLSLAHDLTGPGADLDDDAYARGAWWLASLAIEAVSDPDSAGAWLAVLDAVEAAGTDRAALGSALQPTLALLAEPRDACWPALADLQRLAADLGAETPPPTAPADEASPSLAAAQPETPAPPGRTATSGEPSAVSPGSPVQDAAASAPEKRRGDQAGADGREQPTVASTAPGAAGPRGRRRTTARW